MTKSWIIFQLMCLAVLVLGHIVGRQAQSGLVVRSSFVGIAIVAMPAGIIIAGYMDKINDGK